MFLWAFLSLFSFIFIFLAWKKFEWGLALLFLLLPTYLIRFHIGPLPSTVLEIMIWMIVGVWIIKEIRNWKLETRGNVKSKSLISNFLFLISKNRLLTVGIILFLIAATISVFTSLNIRAALGEWKTFYVEPILIFFVLMTTIRQYNDHNNFNNSNNHNNSTIVKLLNCQIVNFILFGLILSGFITSIFAIYQHFTGFLVPHAFWANQNTYRVTGWYGFPNAVGLFLAPLIPLALYLIKDTRYKIQKTKKQDTTINNQFENWNLSLVSWKLFLVSCFLFIPTSLLSIIYAKSTGGLIGVAAGIGVLLLLYKKTRWPAIILGLVSLVSLVSLQSLSPIKQELTFQDRSGQIRIAMWKEATELLKDRPILGAGLTSYTQRVVPYHKQVNGENIEIFHHQHNIFLTMWMNLGLIGVIGFILILVWFYKTGVRNWKLETRNWGKPNTPISNFQFPIPIYLLSSMTTLLVTGLVDSPYIKNDLSLFFWLLVALMAASTLQHHNNKTILQFSRSRKSEESAKHTTIEQ